MEKEKITAFSILNDDNVMTLDDIEQTQFQKVHFKVYSADKVNAHNYTCSLKVLKKYAKTIAGKPILVWYNRYANGGKGDFAGHEDSVWAKQYPVGFFPNNVKITYEKDDDGTIFLCADGYIWSLYYSEIVKVFEDYGGIKGVSSEMLIIDSEMIEDTDIENILQYSFAALTLIGEHDALGNPIKPAVDGCQGVLVANAITNSEYEKAKNEFEKILYNSVNQESEETGSFFNIKNKEEKMETEVIKNSTSPDVTENATQEVSTAVGVSTDTYSYDDDGKYIGSTHEEHILRTTETKEVSDEEIKSDEEVVENTSNESEEEKLNNADVVENSTDESCKADNACKSKNECKSDNAEQEVQNTCKTENSSTVDMEEFEALKVKCATLENQLREKESDYQNLLLKCNALETYKSNKENENMKNTIEVALNSVSHILSSSQIDEWREESKNCSVNTVDGFINKLKAFAFDVQEKNGVIQTDSIRNAIPKEMDMEPSDLWERLDKKYS